MQDFPPRAQTHLFDLPSPQPSTASHCFSSYRSTRAPGNPLPPHSTKKPGQGASSRSRGPPCPSEWPSNCAQGSCSPARALGAELLRQLRTKAHAPTARASPHAVCDLKRMRCRADLRSRLSHVRRTRGTMPCPAGRPWPRG